MVLDPSRALADKIEDGSYVPSRLDSCEAILPLDEHPHSVRLTQFLLFTKKESEPTAPDMRKPKPVRPPEYMTLAKHHVGQSSPDEEEDIKKQISLIAGKLAASPPIIKGIVDGSLPNPLSKNPKDLDTMGNILAKHAEAHPDDEATAAYKRWRKDKKGKNLSTIYDIYERWLRQELWQEIHRLKNSFGCIKGISYATRKSLYAFPESLLGNVVENIEKIIEGLREHIEELLRAQVFTPGEAPLNSPHPHFALAATYEQRWEPQGYTRGELLNSFSIAPGEQLTMEFHYWDKTTRKREEELAAESELRISSKLTLRDHQETVFELATEMGGKLSGKAGITIPIPAGDIPLPVTVGANGELQGKINTNIKNTMDRTSERTLDAARVMKNSRRVRVEVAREIGREEKQTRVIANTNRCHTLNAFYFEVMANYLVTTRLVSVEPCVLISIPDDFKYEEPKWVLCHEDALKQALLDPVFLPGFESAKILEALDRLEEIKKKQSATSGTEETTAADSLEQEFCRDRDAIINSFSVLKTAQTKVLSVMQDPACQAALLLLGPVGFLIAVVAKLNGDLMPLRQFLYLAVLQVTPHAINVLDKLNQDKGQPKPCRESIRNFFAAVEPRDFEYNVIAAMVAKGMAGLGVPEDLIDALIDGGILSYLEDDAGLYPAVKAAYKRHKEKNEGPLVEVTEQAPSGLPIEAGVEGYGLIEQAEANVEFQRLSDHLWDQREHYQQAIWLKKHPDVRARHLQAQGAVASFITHEILGFNADKVAYPIVNLDRFDLNHLDARYQNLKQIILLQQAVPNVLAALKPTEKRLVTLPTRGTVLEVTLGTCDGCEDYIQQSRAIDLRKKDAQASHEEAEAERRRQRLSSSPPDLGEFQSWPRGKLTINLAAETSEDDDG